MTEITEGVWLLHISMVYDPLIYAAIVLVALVGAARLLYRLIPFVGG